MKIFLYLDKGKYMNEKLLELEKLRKKTASVLIIVIVITIIITILFLFIFISKLHSKNAYYIPILLGGAVGLLLAKVTGYTKRLEEYSLQFKSVFIGIPFKSTFNNVAFRFENGFNKDFIDKTGMIQLGNRYFSNDYVEGTYKNIKFQRSDILIQQRTYTGKHSHTITFFNGRWIVVEFNKDFHFDLQIVGAGFHNSNKKKSVFTHENERRHRIDMEDIEFNQRFHVYGQDDHEAFYILTPHFMKLLKDMYSSMDGAFMLGFVNNQLHVAINTKQDAMEPSIFRSIDFIQVDQDVKREMQCIMDIIDGLYLDRNLYKI